jgi:lincosamide nucleotidyltransferase A/C/D/E
MTRPPRLRSIVSASGQSALRAARELYGRIERSPAGPVLRTRIVQRTRQQLQVRMQVADVLEVLDGLEASGLDVWIAGGWGVDALLGGQTREHVDLDLVVDLAHEGEARAALERLGFGPIRAERFEGAMMPKQTIMRDRAGRVVDLHGVDTRTWPGSWRELRERAGCSTVPFDAAEPFVAGALDGRRLGCLSPELQLASRQGYELTEAAVADARALCARFDIAEPPFLRAAT